MDEPIRPFSQYWNSFGFGGQPVPGYDYSWIEIQRYLTLIGCEDYINNCKLFFSPRNPKLFLIRTDKGWDEVWDTVDITFSLLSPAGSVLVASYNGRCIHLSGISTSLIEILMKSARLPLYSLDNCKPFPEQPFEVNFVNQTPEIPKDASLTEEEKHQQEFFAEKQQDQISIQNSQIQNFIILVSLSSPTLPKHVQGKLDYRSSQNIKIISNEDTLWEMPKENISSIQISPSNQNIVVISSGNDTFDLTFSETCADERNDFLSYITEEIQTRNV